MANKLASVTGKNIGSVVFGFLIIGFALVTLPDEQFCAKGCGGYFFEAISEYLYRIFGHWGPTAFLLMVGILIVVSALTPRDARNAENSGDKSDAPSNP